MPSAVVVLSDCADMYWSSRTGTSIKERELEEDHTAFECISAMIKLDLADIEEGYDGFAAFLGVDLYWRAPSSVFHEGIL